MSRQLHRPGAVLPAFAIINRNRQVPHVVVQILSTMIFRVFNKISAPAFRIEPKILIREKLEQSNLSDFRVIKNHSQLSWRTLASEMSEFKCAWQSARKNVRKSPELGKVQILDMNSQSCA